ncbi:hypothetical protein G8C92_05995 [Paenibacillus donghaensis]|uniref:hypothetical protein n=1 Tax=Paenibacillus donghaensis TaxID=414771 RepID=UPI0018838253|nr:hypothetical protein [Paenibacillus donghaensis]MBE9913581.1 hypothetical protein [Paenibacillus donghaensis]
MGTKIVSTIILLLLGGCGVPSTPVDLIEPPLPETSLQNKDIVHDFIKMLPHKAQILTPMEENRGSDVSFGDLDGDGIDEAVIVYEEKNKTGKMLKAALFRKHQEEWHKVTEVDGFGYGLDYAGILDINHDGRSELALGWSLGEAGNGLDIYGWQDDKLKLLSKKVYQGKLDLE